MSLCGQEVWEWKEAGEVFQAKMQKAGQKEGLFPKAAGRREDGIRLTVRLMETVQEIRPGARLMAEAGMARKSSL